MLESVLREVGFLQTVPVDSGFDHTPNSHTVAPSSVDIKAEIQAYPATRRPAQVKKRSVVCAATLFFF